MLSHWDKKEYNTPADSFVDCFNSSLTIRCSSAASPGLNINTTAQTIMPDNEISFDPNSLYILISDIGEVSQFHWAFYLALGPNHGTTFHTINNRDTGSQWQYQTKPSIGIPNSKTLLLALRISIMHPTLHSALAERLAAVPVIEPVTCRLWLKQALFDLDNEGYIKLTREVDDIEMEGILLAEDNKKANQRSAMESKGTEA